MAEEDRAGQDRARRRLGRTAALAGGAALIGLAAIWIGRRPIVAHFVDRALAGAHVPAGYDLVAVGPFEQRLEHVRIGPAGAPDLVARSLVLRLGYGWDGPRLAGVAADGVRLHARIAGGRLSLGAIDRLLPRASGGAGGLPDLRVRLDDGRVALDTPAGPVAATIDGDGNLRDSFRATLVARAPLLAAGGCAARGIAGIVALHVRGRRPIVDGPVDVAALSCPRAGLALGTGRATIAARLADTLDSGQGGVALSGFAGTAGVVRFASLSGLVTATGTAGQLDGTVGLTLAAPVVAGGGAGIGKADIGKADRAELGGRFRLLPRAGALTFSGDATLRHAALSADRQRALLAAAGGADGAPVAPLVHRLVPATARLLTDANAAARLSFTSGGPDGMRLGLRTAAVAGRGGAFLRMADEGEGVAWRSRDGLWRAAGRVTAGGDGLPALDIRFGQDKAGGPVDGVARLAPYAVGGARLAMTPLRFVLSGAGARFDTVLTLDGPLPSGGFTGLRVPAAGWVDRRGAFAIGRGCLPVSFRALRAGGMRLDSGRVRLCGVDGAPIFARGADGRFRYGVQGADLRFAGHSGDAPLLVASDRAEISAAALSARGLAVRIGEGDGLTRLDVATLDGRYRRGVLDGRFDGASARIGHVPLLLDRMAGDWEFAGGALVLDGGLVLSDMAGSPRFLPLVAHDAMLRFGEGAIDASARLREPKSDALAAQVDIHHDLVSGAGHATLDVPGLHFVPKGFQPEALTPLTLGVIANVNGTVAGQGRIDWTAQGVASTGDFHTDGTDLAAAFGPVDGIRGAIHFSDLLALATPPGQAATVAEVNPGIAVSNGEIRYQLLPGFKVKVESAHWPFSGGDLDLEPTLLDFDESARRHLAFRVKGLDAAAFVQQLAFPNISATGLFDGVLPMTFDQSGGRIDGGWLKARPAGGRLAYVGELSSARIGALGRLAFDALKAIRYQSLLITLDGRLDGEIISGVRFDGLRQATGNRSLVSRAIADLPFRFNIVIRAPFRGLLGSARAFADPSVVLADGASVAVPPAAIQPAAIQPAESDPLR